MMPLKTNEACQQKVSASVIFSLVFLEVLLVAFVVYLCLSWNETVGEVCHSVSFSIQSYFKLQIALSNYRTDALKGLAGVLKLL